MLLIIILLLFFVIIFGLNLQKLALASASASTSTFRFWPHITSLFISDVARRLPECFPVLIDWPFTVDHHLDLGRSPESSMTEESLVKSREFLTIRITSLRNP